MTKRKGKSTNKQDDSLLLLETPSVTPQRGFKEYAVPAIVFFIFAVGGSTAVWFCSHQQHTIDSLTETVNAMQLRITKFQQQLGIANVGVFEERLQALEKAYTHAQKKADVALATSEKATSTDLQSQFWSLQSEMNVKLSELKQESVSTATLNAMVKNKTEEIETLKQKLNYILTANSEVAVTISGLTDTVLVTKTHLDQQMSTTEGLKSELEEQRMEISSLKEFFISNKRALERNRQEVMDIKELMEIEQARRSQVLEDQLMAVRRSLEDHQKSNHCLHSHLAPQPEIIQSQMSSESQLSSSEKNIPVEEHQVEQAETQQQVPIKEEGAEAKDQAITEEEAVEEFRVEEGKGVVPEELQVHWREPVEKQADDNKIPEEAEVKEEVAEEQAVTEDDEQVDEVPFHQDIVEKEAVTQQDEKPEKLQVSDKEVPAEEEESIETQVVTEEDVITEKVQVSDRDVIEEQAVTEGDAISEEVQVNVGEQAITERDEITEEIPDQEEEAVLAKEDSTCMEEIGTDTSVAEAVENFSEDQLVEDISQEQTLQEPLEGTEKQKDLEEIEEHVQDSEEEEEEPAEEIVEELDEKDIFASES